MERLLVYSTQNYFHKLNHCPVKNYFRMQKENDPIFDSLGYLHCRLLTTSLPVAFNMAAGLPFVFL